jgi:hypothetical protein
LNRSCAEVGSVIPAVIAGYRAFQQFAPEPESTNSPLMPITGGNDDVTRKDLS